MVRLKYPHGFQPITKKLKEGQVIERLKALCDSTRRVLDEKTLSECQDSKETTEEIGLYQNLLEHLTSLDVFENPSSDEVSILLACCIANIFGIISPDVPLKDPAVLKCIAAFNIFDLALELTGDDTSSILKELIKNGFNAVKEKPEDDSRHVQSMIIAQCSQLLQRIDQISNPIIDAIFYFLVPPQKVSFQ
ncbi:unnamed protein product [Enterobius vermicularis]|uniref:DCB domain-containing protein n=1 Tax=Enterobius vermicularis TaxID=51028 RepID=A0A0N4V0H2_ENTVE|nr:unnamed protein product [Enterobius vermicularis]